MGRPVFAASVPFSQAAASAFGTVPLTYKVTLCHGPSGLEFFKTHRRRRSQLVGHEPRVPKLPRARHREAARMCHGNQFFWIRALPVFTSRRKRILSLRQHAPLGGYRPFAALQTSLPCRRSCSLHELTSLNMARRTWPPRRSASRRLLLFRPIPARQKCREIIVEQVPDASDGYVRWWKASQYLPVHGIVALARKHGRDARGPGGFHG